eukprot:TRINITY_DN44343_c0_g1_i1.p2 TRINITY_DN44343_c0_g1~~TRINITY_DN44343_c0_g1_i1.p2  ORF type:complete len:210 (-),score=45.26 TRINITY_DN44343_c0_g1_i1:5-634(-)
MAEVLSSADSVSAALTGSGTGFSARESAWVRATGSSQWHLPGDLYQSGRKANDEGLIFPSTARSMLRVDCVTEAPNGAAKTGTAAAGRGLTKEDIIDGDPFLVLDRLEELLPAKILSRLAGGEFLESMLADFDEVAGGREMLLEDAASMVCTLANSLRTDPMLQLSEEHCLRLARQFDVEQIRSVGPQEFLDLMRFTVAVRYTELTLGQ